jgi:hypothetical protein
MPAAEMANRDFLQIPNFSTAELSALFALAESMRAGT